VKTGFHSNSFNKCILVLINRKNSIGWWQMCSLQGKWNHRITWFSMSLL